MHKYHEQIAAYEAAKVNLPEAVRVDLYAKRDANRARLKKNVPAHIRINDDNFIPQGSMAIRTTVHENDRDYDIDDGVWFYKKDLVKHVGSVAVEMTALEVQEMVRDALKDPKFNKQPEIHNNCVRVFYNEGYHVDIPCYRLVDEGKATERQELAAADNNWAKSHPTEITVWFEDSVTKLNKAKAESGGQLRRIVRLIKRFARSRGDKWDMPNGLKLTILVEECFQAAVDRDDTAFYKLLKNLSSRLWRSLAIYNRAQTTSQQDKLTKTDCDANMTELRTRVDEALKQLAVLESSNCTKKAARIAWDWVFQSEGFFRDYDEEQEEAPVASVTPAAPFVKTPTRFG
jgi:hypothetical protein